MEPNCPARSKEGKGITAVNPQAETRFVCWHVFFFLVLPDKKPPPATCGRIYLHRGPNPLNDRRDGGRPQCGQPAVYGLVTEGFFFLILKFGVGFTIPFIVVIREHILKLLRIITEQVPFGFRVFP